LTSIHPVRSLPLKRSTHLGMSAAWVWLKKKMNEAQRSKDLVRMKVMMEGTLISLLLLASLLLVGIGEEF